MKFLSKKFIAISLLLSVICASCQEQKPTNNASIDQFVTALHEKIKKEDFKSLYQSSAQEFKDQINEESFIKSMMKINSILGAPIESTMIGKVETKSSNGKPLTAVQYSTKYEHGTGVETLHLEYKDERYILFQYNLNSDDFMKRVMTE